MSNNKQSSIELFAIAIYEKFKMEGNGKELNDLLEQAKAKHEQEITDAHTTGYVIGGGNGDIYEPKQYYNETFGGNNEQQ